jgi:6-pyruvoyltetrahydropterin/6-carboxytetrahydropterin synthase
MYRSGKIFKNVASVCYRRDDVLCGYTLSFHYEFASEKLDVRNRVFDFGGLKPLELLIKSQFDNKTIVSEDDPYLEWYNQGNYFGTIDLVILPRLSCGCFAKLGYDLALPIVKSNADNVDIVYCAVYEHEYNWGKYVNPKYDNS